MKEKELFKNQKNTVIIIVSIVFALVLKPEMCFPQEFSNTGNLISPDYHSIDVGSVAMPTFEDFDNDGELDLYIGESSGNIKVFTNDGTGRFLSAANMQADGIDINQGSFPVPVFVDLDNDNDLDLYVGIYDGFINVYNNDGNDNFSYSGHLQADGIDIDIGLQTYHNFADIDGDNDLDLYVSSGGNVKVYLNDGSANFSAIGNLQADDVDIYVSRAKPTFADLDNDNDLDLYIAYGYTSIYINTYTNDGNGNFSYSGRFKADGTDLHFVDELSISPVFADVDKDNDLDLYVGYFYGNIRVFINNGSGIFTSNGLLQEKWTTIDIGDRSKPTFSNIDGDSDIDLFIGQDDGLISVYLNDGTNQYSSDGYLQADATNIDVGSNSSPVFANIDGDTDIDLFSGALDGKIYVFTNNGTGYLNSTGNLQADGSDIDVGESSMPVFADIDNDYDLDLYVGRSGGQIRIFLNDGSGSFNAAGNMQSDGSDIDILNWAAPEFLDIDGDGDLDLFVGDEEGQIRTFLNDGSGNFTSAGNLLADQTNIDVGDFSVPVFANTEDTCIPNLFIGNTDGKIIVFTGIDNTNPEINSIHENIVLTDEGNCEANLPDYTSDITATDNCDTNLDVTQIPTAGTTISGATNQITLTVTDDAGNTDDVSFNAAVEDITNPTITCVDNQTIYLSEGQTAYTVSGNEFDPVETGDNCGISGIENDFNNLSTLDGAEFQVGTTTIEWLVTDNANNSQICSFDVTIHAYNDIENVNEDEISIYPNPTKGKTNISFAGTNIQKITISDITGKIIIEKIKFKENEDIDLSSFERGIYIINIQTDKEIFIEKIVKE